MRSSKSNLLPRFSIVIPFKRGKEYLQKCVESVRSQTIRNFELVILADNESNFDGAIDWLNSLPDPEIRLEHSNKPLNINENWSRIGKAAQGEYLTILGYDDILSPHYLQTISELIENQPLASLYLTHFNFIDSNGSEFETSPTMEAIISGPFLLKKILKSEFFVMATGYMMKTADFLKVGGVPLQYPNLLYADFELWLRITGLNYLAVSPVIAFSFRIHQSTTKVTNAKLMIGSFERFIEYLVSIQDQNEYKAVIDAEIKLFLLSHCNEICYRVIRSPVNNLDKISVKDVIGRFTSFAKMLKIEPINYLEQKNIRLAYRIDSNRLLRRVYLIVRQLIKKPLLKFNHQN